VDVGDRVKLVRGNPFGKIGTIKLVLPMKGPVNLTYNPTGLKDGQYVKYFSIEADDGTMFSGNEDDLELVERKI
jgi:hypothetical protein